MDQKTCNTCGKIKPLSEFYPRKDSKHGYRNNCIECFLAKSHIKYLSLMEDCKDKVPSRPRRKYSEAFLKTHSEEIEARELAWRESHKKVIAERKVTRHHKCVEERDEYLALHPKIKWVVYTVGHHHLTGEKARQQILTMAEQSINCPICGCELLYFGKENNPNSASLDRKHNDDSINIEDFWIICLLCNVTKLDRNMEEMDVWCLQWQKARQSS